LEKEMSNFENSFEGEGIGEFGSGDLNKNEIEVVEGQECRKF